jgi:hypothetical protein
MTPVGLAGSMLSWSASWKSPGARGGPPRAVRAIVLLLLCSGHGSVILVRGMVGANLDLTRLAFVTFIFWPLVVLPVRWHRILCNFRFSSGMITLVLVDT